MYAAVSAACYIVSDVPKTMRLKTYQIVELDGVNTLVDACNDLHGNGCRIDMVWVKTVTQSRDTCCDLVELNAFLAPICTTC